MYKCDWWKKYKTDSFFKLHLRESFLYKMPLREERLLDNIKSGSLSGYIDCDMELLENLREAFAHVPPIFRIINVGRDDSGPFVEEYVEKGGLLTQLKRMLNSSFFMESGTMITPLLLFYLDLGQTCIKVHHFMQNTPMKCFDNFVQSAVNVRKEGDENVSSSVVAKTMKLLANSC